MCVIYEIVLIIVFSTIAGLMPQGVVIGTLLGTVLYVRFSPDDQTVAVCAGNRIYILNAKVSICL